MSRFGKYSIVYRLGLSRALVYRANLLMGAVNIVIWFGSLILLYKAIGGSLGSYSPAELVTYILGTSFLASVLFNNSISDKIADEIVEGDIVNYLLQPVNYFVYWLARTAAMRTPLVVLSMTTVFLLSRLVASDVIVQTDPLRLLQTGILMIGSFTLMTLFDFIAGMFSFWTERGFGPRWLMMILARFLSGAALPIALMPGWTQTFFYATPFPSLVSAPVETYLGHLNNTAFFQTLVVQWGWICACGIVVAIFWRRGLKIYAAYGS